MSAAQTDPGATPPADTLAATARPGRVAAELRRGDVVDRYVVLSLIGRGGMGVVYAAYDPQLDRKVALKLHISGEGPAARARMLREAQAMAQITHPSVVAVHDLGTLDDRVWIVMEFVSGRTLTRWLAERRRGWREVLALFVRIGEGLQVAHAAGLVHRDIKPENIMVEETGGVRILDFGLARGGAAAPRTGSLPGSLPGVPQASALDVSLTLDGAVLGTPRYMAPEQWESGAIDPRTDQFSFCVALWEALFGEPPFPGATVPELALAVLAGRIRSPPAGARVPARVRRAVQRGLAVDPAGRWPTMQLLLAELRRLSSRRRWLAGAVALGLALAAPLAGWSAWRAHHAAACRAQADALAEVWNPAVAATLRAAMLATELPFARVSADQTIRWFDAHAGAWASTRRTLCERADLDDDTRARAEACLDERRAELAELIVALRDGGREAVLRAVDAAAGLLSPTRCADPRALRSYEPAPVTGEVAAARRALARALAELAASRYDAAAAALAEVDVHAAAVDHPGLGARIRLVRGLLASARGDYPGAVAELDAVVTAADALGDPWMLAEAALALARVVGVQQEQPAPGLLWGRLAEMWLARSDDEMQRIRLANNLAGIHYARGAYDEAQAAFRRALASAERVVGPDHPLLADLLNNLGAVQTMLDDPDAAGASLARALALVTGARGPDHPDRLEILINLGNLSSHRHELDAARRHYEEALALGARTLGEAHPSLLPALLGLGYLAHRRGDLDAAEASLRRALAIAEAALGPDQPTVADVLNNLGALAQARGDLDTALEHHTRALALRTRALGPDHPARADSLHNLAAVLAARGEHRRARERFAESLALRERALGPSHRDVAGDLVALARVDLELRDPARARQALERALAVPALADDPTDAAEARFLLARALAGPDRRRALALARGALAELDLASPEARALRDAITAWLAEGGRP